MYHDMEMMPNILGVVLSRQCTGAKPCLRHENNVVRRCASENTLLAGERRSVK
jgi:hypothetical protein